MLMNRPVVSLTVGLALRIRLGLLAVGSLAVAVDIGGPLYQACHRAGGCHHHPSAHFVGWGQSPSDIFSIRKLSTVVKCLQKYFLFAANSHPAYNGKRLPCPRGRQKMPSHPIKY